MSDLQPGPALSPDGEPHRGRRWLIAGLACLVGAAIAGRWPPVTFLLGILSAAILYGFLLRRAGVKATPSCLTVAGHFVVLFLAIPASTRMALVLALAMGSVSYIVQTARDDRTLILGLVTLVGIGFGISAAAGTVGIGILVVSAQVIAALTSLLLRPNARSTQEVSAPPRGNSRQTR